MIVRWTSDECTVRPYPWAGAGCGAGCQSSSTRRTKVFSTAFLDTIETATQDDKIVSKLKQEFSIDTERISSFIKIMNGGDKLFSIEEDDEI